MTTTVRPSPPVVTASETTARAAGPTTRAGGRWAREAAWIVSLYAAYSFVRGQFGSTSVDPVRAAANADAVIDLERRLGIFNELAVQRWFLPHQALVHAMNDFYGVFHFVMPIAVLVGLYVRAPERYTRARNALIATTLFALVGFALFPMMPPRLLCACPMGSGADSGFVDTLASYGGVWSFGSHGVGAVSNQYAAMPSLHFAWALWCAWAVLPLLRRRGARLAMVLYPIVTLVVVVVTANHFWLDAVGGAVVCGAGVVLAHGAARLSRVETGGRSAAPAVEPAVEPARI